jgi:hypothetical protein
MTAVLALAAVATIVGLAVHLPADDSELAAGTNVQIYQTARDDGSRLALLPADQALSATTDGSSIVVNKSRHYQVG